MNKTDFHNKVPRFNWQISSDKTKHLELQEKLNILMKKNYDFFLGRIYLTSNDGSQNAFVYQPIFDALELK